MIDFLRRVRDRFAIGRVLHAKLREPYYMAMSFVYPRGVEVELLGTCKVRLHPRMLGMLSSSYEPELAAAFGAHVKPGMTVLDIGAHVGLHTLRLCKLVGQAGRVIAVEPSPANAAALRQHLAWNQITNATVIEAAISGTVGTQQFSFRPDAFDPGGFANSIAYEINGAKTQVRVSTIDEICAALIPDVIKLDVEGAEQLAINGALETLTRHSPIILVAFHPEPMAALGTTPRGLVQQLNRLEYMGQHLDGRPSNGEPGFEELLFTKKPK